jgi:hypothetical protein
MLGRVVTMAALAVGGVMLSKKFKGNNGFGASSGIVETIEINVPVSTAYNQFKHLHWRANVAGEEKEWDAEITEQIPDDRIAWRSVTGVKNGGVVTFHKISDTVTRIALQMDYEPEGALETLGDALGAVRMEARANLANLKEMLEQRGSETGAWRGKVEQH